MSCRFRTGSSLSHRDRSKTHLCKHKNNHEMASNIQPNTTVSIWSHRSAAWRHLDSLWECCKVKTGCDLGIFLLHELSERLVHGVERQFLPVPHFQVRHPPILDHLRDGLRLNDGDKRSRTRVWLTLRNNHTLRTSAKRQLCFVRVHFTHTQVQTNANMRQIELRQRPR